MGLYAKEPDWQYRIRLNAGGEIVAAPRDCIRVLDKRTPQASPQTVWEVRVNGVVRRLWPEDIAGIEQESVA